MPAATAGTCPRESDDCIDSCPCATFFPGEAQPKSTCTHLLVSHFPAHLPGGLWIWKHQKTVGSALPGQAEGQTLCWSDGYSKVGLCGAVTLGNSANRNGSTWKSRLGTSHHWQALRWFHPRLVKRGMLTPGGSQGPVLGPQLVSEQK